MTREERLKFCSICQKRQMDMQRGLVCSLTNEYATFVTKRLNPVYISDNQNLTISMVMI